MAAAEEAPRKVFIRTYGCQMNVYDSEQMGQLLARDGYAPTDSADKADLILINTCHIREKAAEKVYSELGRLRRMKHEAQELGRNVTIGVVGCVAQAEGGEILRRSDAVDLVVGPQSYHLLPELLDKVGAGERPVATDFDIEAKFKPAPEGAIAPRRALSAFLTIQEGCDKFCTFCVVPFTRGSEVSRPAQAIVAEGERLAQSGTREITLLGQNVNAWHGLGMDGKEWGLARLLYRLAEIPGIERLRYTTSHPNDMSEDLITAHQDLRQLMPQLHLPVQSGSDPILKAMNRRHSVADYLKLIDRLRAARPDIALSSDFIVGFPGESEADFSATLALVERVAYASAYSFKYSPRPGTKAAERGDQIPEEAMNERLLRLQALIAAQQDRFNQARIGGQMDVLFERPGRHKGQLVGRSPYLQAVHAEAGSELIGRIVPVQIEALMGNSLRGRLGGHAGAVHRRAEEALA